MAKALTIRKMIGALGIGLSIGFATLPLLKSGEEQGLEREVIVAQETAPSYRARETNQEPEKEQKYEAREKIEPRQDDKYSYLTAEFINAMITEESHGNPRATSRVGARGLMQLMEPTWKEETRKLYGNPLDFDEAYNPKMNREVGTSYCKTIADFLSKYHPNWDKLNEREKQSQITAAYNGGIGRLKQRGFDIEKMPYETRNHVKKVMKHMK